MTNPEHIETPSVGVIRWNWWGRASGSLERRNLSDTAHAAIGSYGIDDPYESYTKNTITYDNATAPAIARDLPKTGLEAWNDERDDFKVRSYESLPAGLKSTPCGKCGAINLSGAIIDLPNGKPAISSADAIDPSILCIECLYWRD